MSVRIAGRRRGWAAPAGALALGLGLVGPLGCREPHDVVPVAPPGVTLERVPVGPQTEPQAIGEAGPAAVAETKPSPPADAPKAPPTAVGVPTKTASGLEYVTLKEGTGPTAEPGQTVTMHYTGTLTDGKVFDSSRTKGANGTPFETPIGLGRVVKGWDQGVPGMKVGEVRKLTIPPELGYGKRGKGSVPPDATMIFEVELLGVK